MQTVVLVISSVQGTSSVRYSTVDAALQAYENLVDRSVGEPQEVLEVKIVRPDKGTVLTLIPGMSKEFVEADLSTPFVWAQEDNLKVRPVLKPKYYTLPEPINEDGNQQPTATSAWRKIKNWFRGARK